MFFLIQPFIDSDIKQNGIVVNKIKKKYFITESIFIPSPHTLHQLILVNQ